MIDVEYLRHCGDDLSVINDARAVPGTESEPTYQMVDIFPLQWERVDNDLSEADQVFLMSLAQKGDIDAFAHTMVTFRVTHPFISDPYCFLQHTVQWNAKAKEGSTYVIISGSIIDYAELLQKHLPKLAAPLDWEISRHIDATLTELFPHAWEALKTHGVS